MRKANAENNEEDIKPTPPIKKRDRAKPKAQRPKSQPPVPLSGGGGGMSAGGTGDDRNSASSHSHSSQEELCARGMWLVVKIY